MESNLYSWSQKKISHITDRAIQFFHGCNIFHKLNRHEVFTKSKLCSSLDLFGYSLWIS